MADSSIARRLEISGRVQGVGFRAFVLFHAQKLELDGFVRNRADGTVEALATGDAQKVEALIALCHGGPPGSRVTEVKVSEAQGIVDKGFRQLPTV
jgi:acylphosphatase